MTAALCPCQSAHRLNNLAASPPPHALRLCPPPPRLETALADFTRAALLFQQQQQKQGQGQQQQGGEGAATAGAEAAAAGAAESLHVRGRLLERMAKPDAALADYCSSLAANPPGGVECLRSRAGLHRTAGRHADALRDLDECV